MRRRCSVDIVHATADGLRQRLCKDNSRCDRVCVLQFFVWWYPYVRSIPLVNCVCMYCLTILVFSRSIVMAVFGVVLGALFFWYGNVISCRLKDTTKSSPS